MQKSGQSTWRKPPVTKKYFLQKLKETVDKSEQARMTAAEVMYGNLGVLMNKFRDNPVQVEEYFDLSIIRTHIGKTVPEPYAMDVVAASQREAGISFDKDTEFTFYNSGEVPLFVYTGSAPETPCPANAIVVNPEEEKTVMAEDLGSITNRYLFIANKDENVDGSVEIMVS